MKILRAADAFCARRREGPYRFIQNRSRISVVALKSDAAAEKPKDQLSRDFLGCSIFDFCNKIGRGRMPRTHARYAVQQPVCRHSLNRPPRLVLSRRTSHTAIWYDS